MQNPKKLVLKIISSGIRANASDIHLENSVLGLAVRYRIDGLMQSFFQGDVAAKIARQARSIISKFKVLSEMDIAENRRSQEGSFRMRTTHHETTRIVDFRVTTLQTQFGEDLVIRVLDKKCHSLSLGVLSFPAQVVDAIHAELDIPGGLFLVTGPAGAGKSATLHALLTKINRPELKSMTVEDPIEYSLEGVQQTEVNEDIGNTFDQILRTFMRQDPDNIMIGEVRDAETATLAIKAALAGNTILSSLQTIDATSAVTRLLGMGIDPNSLSSTLRGVISQRLVRVLCSNCRERHVPEPLILSKFSFVNTTEFQLFRGKGCPACTYTGYSGRRPVVEFWIPTSDELLQLAQKLDSAALRAMVFSTGKRVTMIEDGIELVKKGETTLEELLRVIPYAQISELDNRLKANAQTSVKFGNV